MREERSYATVTVAGAIRSSELLIKQKRTREAYYYLSALGSKNIRRADLRAARLWLLMRTQSKPLRTPIVSDQRGNQGHPPLTQLHPITEKIFFHGFFFWGSCIFFPSTFSLTMIKQPGDCSLYEFRRISGGSKSLTLIFIIIIFSNFFLVNSDAYYVYLYNASCNSVYFT